MIVLVVAGSRQQPWREGELAFYPEGIPRFLGRGALPIEEFSSFDKHRPGDPFPPQLGIIGCLDGKSFSRRQAQVTGRGDALEAVNLADSPMFVNGVETKRALVRPGDTIRFGADLLFYCTLRLPEFPALRHTSAAHAFGEPDRYGIVGEGPIAWATRDEAYALGKGKDHVLILGETGVGKSAIAELIHKVSDRARGPYFEKNCQNFNEALMPTELFGKIAGYPTPGPAVQGAFPASEGGTLFLDEAGLLSPAGQGQFLTALAQGTYQVMGESRLRRINSRVVAATNRSRDDLTPDFHFRIKGTIRVLPLRAQREEIPLLVRELLRRRLADDPSLRPLFWEGPTGELFPRVNLRLMEFLVRHELAGNVRQVDMILKAALLKSTGERVEMLPEGSEELEGGPALGAPGSAVRSVPPPVSVPRSSVPSAPPPASGSAAASTPSGRGPRSATPSTERGASSADFEVTKERIEEAYKAARGNHSEAARIVGVERMKLYRIMERLGMAVPGK
jgi:DNA-binding NtrC family response regulator